MVLAAFIDESYPKGMSSYTIAAVVVDLEGMLNLDLEFRQIVARSHADHGTSLDAELHAHSLMQGLDGWKPLASKIRAKRQIYLRCVEAISRHAHVIVECVDVEKQRRVYRKPFPPHSVALTYTLEKISERGERLGEKVIVINDEIPEQDSHMQTATLAAASGTFGWKNSKLPNILQPIRFEDSRYHAGLQAADMVAYLHNRIQTRTADRDHRAIRMEDDLWQALQGCLRHRVWP